MIIKSSIPFTSKEISKASEQFDGYIKTVMDLKKQICVAGMDRHYEGEQILLNDGSKQSNLWGGGIDLATKIIDFNSFINIRPNDNNPSSDILDPRLRLMYEDLTRYFFKEIL
ncbi:MAG: hypothetical protein Fur0011_6950 [Candidatus Microgenomates bacterium]